LSADRPGFLWAVVNSGSPESQAAAIPSYRQNSPPISGVFFGYRIFKVREIFLEDFPNFENLKTHFA